MAMKQLELLVSVQRQREDKLQAQFVQAQQFLLNQQQKYQGLADYRVDYIRQTQQRGADGMYSRQFNQYLNFITKLDQALAHQNLQIQQAQRVVDQRRNAWLAMQKKRKAIEQLIEREHEKLHLVAMRAEQKLSDEVAMQQYFRQLQQAS